MTSNVIVSVPSDFPHVQHAQDQCLLTASRTPLIQETGQMRENRVCVCCFLHVLTALFSMSTSLISPELLSATRETFTLLVDFSQEVVFFARVSFETIAEIWPRVETFLTLPFLTKCWEFGTGSSNLRF